MKNVLLLITILFLFSFCCKKNNTIITQSKMAEKERIFYKVTNRNLARYFKNPADSNKLGKIVETGLLQNSKFANDTLENFLIKLGLCNNDMSGQIYVPCSSTFETIIKVNDNYKTYDTIIGTTNYLPELYAYPYEDDDNVFTSIFVKSKYSNTYKEMQSMSLLSALVGYYVDNHGNKSIVLHDNVFYFTEDGLHWKERLENALVLYKWRNAKYVPDSLLTVDGNLIPKENYAEIYEKYIGKADH